MAVMIPAEPYASVIGFTGEFADDAEWADEILAYRKAVTDRSRGADAVRRAGYDIHDEARKLQEIYLQMADRASSGTRRRA